MYLYFKDSGPSTWFVGFIAFSDNASVMHFCKKFELYIIGNSWRRNIYVLHINVKKQARAEAKDQLGLHVETG